MMNHQNMSIPTEPSQDVQAMRDKLKEQIINNVDVSDMAVKHPTAWTQEELLQAMQERERTKNQAEKEAMFQREREWFDHYYGTEELKYDETGKMIQPQPIRPIPTHSEPVKTADGKSLKQGLEDILDTMTEAEKNLPVYAGGSPNFDERTGKYVRPPGTGIKPQPSINGEPADSGRVRAAVMPHNGAPFNPAKTLQSGLNILSGAQNTAQVPGQMKAPALKEDGIVGPKTAGALKKALVDKGTGKVSEALSLGKFKETIQKTKQKGAENLAGELGATFSPLLGKSKSPKTGFQREGLALQDTINDLGANKPGFQPLKDDGIVGPKTEAAFSQIAKTTDEDELVSQFAQNLGFSF